MDVTIEEDVTALKCFSHHHFGGAVFWILFHTWSNPLSVKIHATQRCTIVANDDAIRIEHGNYFEYKVVPKVLGNLIIWNKELQDTFYNERCITFAWMHARGYHNCSSDGNFFRSWTKVRNDSHFTVITSQCFADDGFTDPVLTVRCAKFLKQFCAIWVRVRITVRQVHFVVIMLELHCESQSVVETSTFFLELILEVAYVLTISVPTIAWTSLLYVSIFFWIK